MIFKNTGDILFHLRTKSKLTQLDLSLQFKKHQSVIHSREMGDISISKLDEYWDFFKVKEVSYIPGKGYKVVI